MARVQRADENALATLYDATSALVHGVAVRILGDAAAAEEVTVEVYHQAWSRAADFDPGRGSPTAWLLAIARSRSLDRMRSSQTRRAQRQLQSMAQQEQSIELADPSPGPELQAQLADQHQQIRRALQELNADQLEVIELAFFEGLTHGAIAARLELPLGTIKTRIRSGVRKLAEQLRPLEDQS